MVSEPTMANITQSNAFFSFITPVKLDQNNFILWRTQILTSIKGNGLEGFINGDRKCPEQFLALFNTEEASRSDVSESRSVNPEFVAWMKTDQLLLSWMMSSIQQSLLTTVIDCTTSKQLWESLSSMFISQSQARIQTLRMQIQTVKKRPMSMAYYFAKIKRIVDTLALAGKLVELNDFFVHVLNGLDCSDYESLIIVVLAREGTITLDDLYSLLLNHENRIKQKKGKIASEVMHHMSANVAQKGQYSGKNNNGYQKNTGGSFGNDNNGFQNNNTPQFAGARNSSDIIYQICSIHGHGANKCINKFNPSFVPQKNFGRGNFRGQYGRGMSFNSFGRGLMFPGPNFVNPYMPRGAAFQSNMAYSNPAFISGYTPFNPYNTFTPDFTYGVSPYFPGNVTNGMSSTSAPPAQAQATCATNPEIIKDPSRYIDSGATSHITNDLGQEHRDRIA